MFVTIYSRHCVVVLYFSLARIFLEAFFVSHQILRFSHLVQAKENLMRNPVSMCDVTTRQQHV